VGKAVGKAVGPLVQELLSPFGLAPGTVARRAVHPGGPRVLDAVDAALLVAP
jgi:predicted naringenin-chalcone synthase